MQKRFVSLWFRYLMTDWLTLRQPELKGVPFALAATERNRIIITASNHAAEKQGIVSGITAADAKAVIPNLKIIDDIPGKAEKLLNALGEWSIRYSPLVAADLPDGLVFDATGCTHLWGGEKGYINEITTRFRNKGYDVRVAMADTPGAAWAIARFGSPGTIVPVGQHVNALLKLSPDALRIEQLAADRLKKLGFYQIRNLVGIKRQVLRRRFGDNFLTRVDQVLGVEDEPLQLINPIEPYHERLPCLEPIRTAIGIESAIKALLEKLCKRLENEGKGLRTAVLKGYRVDGKVVGVDIGTNRPSAHVAHLFKLFELKIPGIEPALGIELFILEAPKVEDLSPEQEILWSAEGCGLENTGLIELLDKLANKIGSKNIRRYLPHESYWPERSIRPALSLNEKPSTQWRTDRPRPTVLLKKPERIEVFALLPDDPPRFFLYKNERHNIKKADDAERIESEWWRRKKKHRDYYVVEDEQGRRYWVFRSGHHTAEGAQWYIHGFFA